MPQGVAAAVRAAPGPDLVEGVEAPSSSTAPKLRWRELHLRRSPLLSPTLGTPAMASRLPFPESSPRLRIPIAIAALVAVGCHMTPVVTLPQPSAPAATQIPALAATGPSASALPAAYCSAETWWYALHEARASASA
jgi:hypothetical protein